MVGDLSDAMLSSERYALDSLSPQGEGWGEGVRMHL
jgi:hypothetical protein